MIRILSWNIQNGKGVDGQISLARIADEIKAIGSPDIICLQEVSRGLRLAETQGRPDQIAELSTLLPGYEPVFGPAIDAVGEDGRWQFGNAMFSRLPIVSYGSHLLPRPGIADRRQMTRQALDVVIREDDHFWRVMTTHLEFHSAEQRLAQVRRLREIYEEAVGEQSMPPLVSRDGPYQWVPRPTDLVVCGDFNMLPYSKEYQALVSPAAKGGAGLTDAWTLVNPDKDHLPTCGIHDREQWAEGPHCRDFFFVAGQLRDRLKDAIVDIKTDASDHQPMMIELV